MQSKSRSCRAATTNRGQKKEAKPENPLSSVKEIGNLNKPQSIAFNKCLKALKGMSIYDAKNVLYALREATERTSLINIDGIINRAFEENVIIHS